MYEQAEQIGRIVKDAKNIVIVQADNPDADSLGSALALEHILGDMVARARALDIATPILDLARTHVAAYEIARARSAAGS